MKEPIFKATHVVKQFGPTIALNDVDIAIYPGEIRGFIGENGSGKSTMSAIMTGIYEATSGSMEYHGKPWKPKSMVDALDGGIGIIVQENGTIDKISVAENIYLGELDNFSGVNFFEERKVENFSPFFDIKSLQSLDTLIESFKEQINKEDLSNKEKRQLVKLAIKAYKIRYEALNSELEATIPGKMENEEVEFSKKSNEEFEKYQASLAKVNKDQDLRKAQIAKELITTFNFYENVDEELAVVLKENQDIDAYIKDLIEFLEDYGDKLFLQAKNILLNYKEQINQIIKENNLSLNKIKADHKAEISNIKSSLKNEDVDKLNKAIEKENKDYQKEIDKLEASKIEELAPIAKSILETYHINSKFVKDFNKNTKTLNNDEEYAKLLLGKENLITTSLKLIKDLKEEVGLVEVRRKYYLNQTHKAYKATTKKLDNASYARRNMIKADLVYLKNHYLNGINDTKELVRSKAYKGFKKFVLTTVFGLFVNGKKLNKYSTNALHKIGVNHIYAKAPTLAYDMQDRKLIEIAKCLNKNPEIFIVDETTTALSEIGRNLLYKKMEELKNAGKSVLFISHDLEELMEKCDTLTVLRDGSIVANLDKSKGEFDAEAIKKFMIGRELKGDYYRSDYDGSHSDEVVLKMVDGIKGRKLKHVNLELHKGEILGLGGLSDCGMHDLGKALFGSIKLEGGFVYVGENLDKQITSEVIAMKHRVGYLSKNRDVEALAVKANIFDNIAIASINNVAKANFFVTKGPEKKLVAKQVRDLQIKCNSSAQLISTLSGGNKQKVSFAKWIANDSEILILDCPTRGVDIGVKQFIYQLLYKMKKEGKSILMISEELPELIGMSDRVVIMKDGQIEKEFNRSKDLTQEEIVKYMI